MILSAIVPVIFGTLLLLTGFGVLPRRVNKPEEYEIWKKKFGMFLKILGSLLLLSGLFFLFVQVTKL
jgi:hypothetical protein